MRQTVRFVLAGFALAVLLAPMAEAQLSAEYAEWEDGPEGYLLTKKEKKEWAKISTDAQAEAFIELFWARRNPEPTNPYNAFRAEFESKVKFADENFGYGTRRGATSDRGRVLILMGRPDGREFRGPQQTGPGQGGSSNITDAVEGNTDIWFYDPRKLSKDLKVKGAQLYFFFYEDQIDTNNFALDRSNRDAFKGISALGRAPDVYLLHPTLMEVPKPVSMGGAESASAAHLAWIDQGSAPFNELVKMISAQGVSDAAHRPLWVHVELPPDAPALDLFAGRVKNADGEVVSNFETSVLSSQGQYGSVYHLAFPLDVGSYTVDIVGAAAEVPQVITSIEAEIEGIAEDGTWMSPLWLGTSASPNPEAMLGEPFTFGGWHLMPISGPELTRESEVAYFGFVVRPALDEEGHVDLKARIRVKRDGKPLGRAFTMPLDPSQIVGDLWMYGNSIGLTGLPEPGAYDLEFQIKEATSDAVTERVLSLDVME